MRFKFKKKKANTGISCALHNLHDSDLRPFYSGSDWFTIISIDPGTVNFAIRVERRKGDLVECLIFDKVNVSNTDAGVCQVYKKLTDFLDKYLPILKLANLILIEKQLKVNYKATRIAQHTISYFTIKLSNSVNLPRLYEVDPKLKSNVLESPPKMNKKEVKKWAITTATKILTERNDSYCLGVLQHFKSKQDDLADTICQIEAFLIYYKIKI